jgi:hypothetical protein
MKDAAAIPQVGANDEIKHISKAGDKKDIHPPHRAVAPMPAKISMPTGKIVFSNILAPAFRSCPIS